MYVNKGGQLSVSLSTLLSTILIQKPSRLYKTLSNGPFPATMSSDINPNRFSLLTATTLNSRTGASGDYSDTKRRNWRVPSHRINSNSSIDSAHVLSDYGIDVDMDSNHNIRINQSRSILDSASTLLDQSRNFSFESLSQFSIGQHEGLREDNVSKKSPLAALLERVADSIVDINSRYCQARNEFYDELSYNIIMSQLLNEKVLISKYSQDMEQPLPIDSKNKAKRGITYPLLTKLNIEKSSSNRYLIRLAQSYQTKILFFLLNIITLKKEFCEKSKEKRFMLLISLLGTLIKLKNLQLNKLIYFSIVHKKLFETSSSFFSINRKLDYMFKKLSFRLKEFAMYSQVNSNDNNNKQTAMLPSASKKSLALAILKNHWVASSLMAYLTENLNLLINHLMLKIASNIKHAVKEHHAKSTLINYFNIYKVELKALLAIVNEFHVLMNNTAEQNQQSFWGSDMTLKPLQLVLRSPKVNPHVDIGNSSENSIVSPDPNVMCANSILNSSATEHSFQQSLRSFETKINDFHMVRKFLLILWLVSMNEPQAQTLGDEFTKELVSEGKLNDDVLLTNILNYLSAIEKHMETNVQQDIPLSLYKDLDSSEKFVTTVHDIVTQYFELNNLSALLSNSAMKIDLSSENSTKMDIVDDLSMNLSRINYKIGKLDKLTDRGSVSLLSYEEYDFENHKQYMSSLKIIETDLVRVLNNYQMGLNDLKQKVSKKNAIYRQRLKQKQFDDSMSAALLPKSTDADWLGRKLKSNYKRNSLPVGTRFSMMSLLRDHSAIPPQGVLLRSPKIVHNSQSGESSPRLFLSSSARTSPSSKSFKRLSTGLQFPLLKISEEKNQIHNGALPQTGENYPASRVMAFNDNYLGIYPRLEDFSLQTAQQDKDDTDSSYYNGVLNSIYDTSYNSFGEKVEGDLYPLVDEEDEEETEPRLSKKELEQELNFKFEAMINKMNRLDHQDSTIVDQSKKNTTLERQHNDNENTKNYIDKTFFLSELKQNMPTFSQQPSDSEDEEPDCEDRYLDSFQEEVAMKHSN